jgi:hypothetical protein
LARFGQLNRQVILKLLNFKFIFTFFISISFVLSTNANRIESGISNEKIKGPIEELFSEDDKMDLEKEAKEELKGKDLNNLTASEEVKDLVEDLIENTDLNIPKFDEAAIIDEIAGNLTIPVSEKDGITCTTNLVNKDTLNCVAKPLLISKGNKVYAADEAVFEYTQGEGIAQIDILSKELFITSKDSQTQIVKSETDLGNAGISIVAKGDKVGGKPTQDSLKDVENAESFQVVATSTRLIHSVTNPNNPNEKKEMLNVRDGVSDSFNINQSEDDLLSIESTSQLNSGFRYDSNPFSSNKVTASSNSTVGMNISFSETTNGSAAVFSASNSSPPDDSESNSQIILTDTRDPNKKNNLIANGNTSIVVAQEFSKDNKPAKTSFLASSDEIVLTSKDSQNLGQTLILNDLNVQGEKDPSKGETNVSATTNSVSLIDDKKNTAAGADGNVSLIISDDNKATIAGVGADRVFVSTNDFEFDADGNVSVSAVDYKEPSKKVDGQNVVSEISASADSIKILQNGKNGTLSGGTNVFISNLEDGSSVQTINSNQGTVTDKKFEVGFSDNATVVNKFDKNQKLTSSTVAITNLSGNNKDGTSFNVTNSVSSLETIGKTKEGIDILRLTHQSESISATDSKYQGDIQNLNAQIVDTHADKYGVASFDSAIIKGLPGSDNSKLSLNSGVVSFYENEVLKHGRLTAKELKLESSDYSVNVSAVGKDGKTENFDIFYFKEGDEEFVSIFNENGEQVKIEGSDKDGNFGDILVSAVDYYQNDKFKTVLVSQASGNLESGDSKYSADFDIAKFSAYESNDGNQKQYSIEDGKIHLVSNEDHIGADAEVGNAIVQQSTVDDLTSTSANLQNGKVSANQYSNDHSKVEQSGQFNFKDLNYSSVGEKDGSTTTALSIGNGEFSAVDNIEGISTSGKFDLMNFYQGKDITSGSIVNGANIILSSEKVGEDFTQATINGLNASGFSTDKVKYGTIQFDNATVTQIPSGANEVDSRVTVLNGAMVFYENSDNPDNIVREGAASASSINGSHQDYTLGVTAIGNDGTPGKFNLYFLEENGERTVQVFGDDGKKVQISGSDKDGNFGDVLFKTASAYEDDETRQFLVSELEVKATDITPSNGSINTSSQLNIAQVAGFQAKDGSFDRFEIDQAAVNVQDYQNKLNANASVSSASFTKTNYLGTISTNLEAYDASINVKDYSGKADLEAQIDMGSVLFQSVEEADGKKMSFIKVNDIELMAMDYDQMIKATGSIGEASYFDNNEMSVIDVKDLKNLKVESLDEDMNALFNGKQFLKVDTKDSNGNVTSSYLLVKDGSLKVSASQNDIDTKFNLNARVFEFVRDEVTGQSVIVKADVDFKATAQMSGNSFVPKATLSGALKGENITTSSSTYEKNDGKIRGGTFNINATKLEHLKLKAKVGFLELASFEAKGKDGKSINYSYQIDETQGVITLRGVYKDGDSLKTKFLFFKLGSHKEGNDAVQSLAIYLKGQSMKDHMDIMSETASLKRVNEFFSVSDGGAIALTAGAGDKGFALELLVVNEKWAFNDAKRYKRFENPTNSFGLAVKYIKDDDSEWGAGIALTSDSKINFDGDLKMFNQDVESLPTTLNLNVTHRNAEGDLGVVGGINVPLTSYMVDTDKLDSDAQFYDNGRRNANGPGAHVAVTKKYTNGELRFSGGMYNNFREPAVALTYQGTPEVLANLGRGIINLSQGEPFAKGQKSRKNTISNYRKQKMRNEAIRDAEIKELEAKRMVVVEKKVDELIKYYANKKGFKRVKEILKIAKDYLNKPVDPSDYRKDIFQFKLKEQVEFAFYEEDEQKEKDIENIILAIIENKIMVQLPLEHKNRLSMYEIYKQRRYYTSLDVLDELNKINESGLEPCNYFRKMTD